MKQATSTRDANTPPAPTATLGILAALWIAFGVDALHPPNLSHALAARPGVVGINTITWPLLHFSLPHLATDTLVIGIAGWYIEHERGPRALLSAAATVTATTLLATALLLQTVETPVFVAGASATGYGLVVVAAIILAGHDYAPSVLAVAIVGVFAGTAAFAIATNGLSPGGGVTAAVHLTGFIGALAHLAWSARHHDTNPTGAVFSR